MKDAPGPVAPLAADLAASVGSREIGFDGMRSAAAIDRVAASAGNQNAMTAVSGRQPGERDINLREEFESARGLDCIFTVTDQPDSPLARGFLGRWSRSPKRMVFRRELA